MDADTGWVLGGYVKVLKPFDLGAATEKCKEKVLNKDGQKYYILFLGTDERER